MHIWLHGDPHGFITIAPGSALTVPHFQAAGSVGEKGGSSYVVAGQSPANRTRTSRGQQGSDAVCREQQDTRAGHTDTGGDTCVVLGGTLRTPW